MKIKKLIILILAALFVTAALCACGGGDNEGGADVDSNGSVYDSYASSSDPDASGEEGAGDSSGSSLNENYFQSSVML